MSSYSYVDQLNIGYSHDYIYYDEAPNPMVVIVGADNTVGLFPSEMFAEKAITDSILNCFGVEEPKDVIVTGSGLPLHCLEDMRDKQVCAPPKRPKKKGRNRRRY